MKKTLFLSIIILCSSIAGFAQQGGAQAPVVLVTLKGDTLKNNTDSIYTHVLEEFDFPGGVQPWIRYLERYLNYPRAAIDNNVQGSVVLRFIVCADGTVCNLEVVSGPELLRQAGFDVMKKTPKWKPGKIDGKAVNSYRMQPINFRLNR